MKFKNTTATDIGLYAPTQMYTSVVVPIKM